MIQSSKERYLAQKVTIKQSKSQHKDQSKNQASRFKTLSSFEKLVLYLVLVFVVSAPLAFLINQDIMIYVALINYFILGFATAFKPDLIIESMRKNKEKFETYDADKIKKLSLMIRVFGILLLAFGIYFLYLFVL